VVCFGDFCWSEFFGCFFWPAFGEAGEGSTDMRRMNAGRFYGSFYGMFRQFFWPAFGEARGQLFMAKEGKKKQGRGRFKKNSR